jgi:DnaJ-class molecular chaperone
MSNNNNKPQNPFPDGIDFKKIMESAQQIAQNMSETDQDNMDMSKMFDHVTDTVFSNMGNGGNIDPASKNQMKAMLSQVMGSMEGEVPIQNSKINLGIEQRTNLAEVEDQKIPSKKTEFEEIDSDTEVDPLRPRVKDMYYDLPVNLVDFYTGKTKKLAIKRDRLSKSGKTVHSEKRKIEIPILPGMRDSQEIRFNREGNEKPGHESGDIVITLSGNAHDKFERSGDTLYYVKNISLYESYAAARGDIKIVIKHLNNTHMILKSDGIPLHTRDGARKVRNGGMPVYRSKKEEYGDLYIRFNVILPDSIEDEISLKVIERLFPVHDAGSIFYPNSPYKGFDVSTVKTRELTMEEVSEEDMEQLDYDDEQSNSDSEYSGSSYD